MQRFSCEVTEGKLDKTIHGAGMWEAIRCADQTFAKRAKYVLLPS